MNHFGKLFTVNIFGESHGESVGVVIDGCPAGMPLAVEDFIKDTERRKGGTQKGTTPRQEEDLPLFKSGIFNGKTTGAPLTLLFENKNTRSGDYEKQRAIPRPGHADFWPTESSVVMKIIVEADISVEGSHFVWWRQVWWPKKS